MLKEKKCNVYFYTCGNILENKDIKTNKNKLRQTKAKRIGHQQICATRNIKGTSLGYT